MIYEDKTIVCRECGKGFLFSAAEQEFYRSIGFDTEPAMCRECRSRRKQRLRHTVYETICADCGGTARLSFEPRHDLPVYCRNCHKKREAVQG